MLAQLARDNPWLIAAVWMSLAAMSSFVAIRLSLAAALVEIVFGVLAGNVLHLHSNVWIDFIAGFGSIMLTFLAGAEIEPRVLREQLRPASVIGVVSFLAPAVAAGLFAFFVLHWTLDAAKIAGIAMSTTSVAVVYAVMIESRLSATRFGQLILAACFVTDLGTVVALGLLFANFNGWLALLVAGIALTMALLPKVLPHIVARTGGRVSEPGMRVLFVVILLLAGIATTAQSEGVLPAYFLGLACAGFLFAHPDVSRRLRAMTLAFLTPFYFIKAGTLVSLVDLLAGIGTIAAFFAVKVGAKIVGVLPAARTFGHPPRHANYLTMMMATGLTFGTISSLYGYTNHYIDQRQYTALVTVVILTALAPTVIAQVFFHPHELIPVEETGIP